MNVRVFGARSASVAAALMVAAMLAGCGSSSSVEANAAASSGTAVSSGTAAVTAADPWVKAVDSGMTAAFMTLSNSSDRTVTLVSASTPSSPQVQLHEMVMQNGTMVMQEKAGGIAIPAGGSTTLEPSGLHIMFMDVTSPIKAGDDIPITLTFDDGQTLAVTAMAKDYSGANESYNPDPSMSMDMGSGASPAMSGMG